MEPRIDSRTGIDLSKSIYLGDGLYATNDGFQAIAFAHNGIGVQHVVYMDNSVYLNFRAYADKLFGIDQPDRSEEG